MKHGKPWSETDLNKLRELYTIHSAKECAAIFGRSEKAISSTVKRYGIKSGRTGCFEKGNIPFNTGKRQEEYMSAEAIDKTTATRFKKGNLPQNYRVTGSERITKDGYIEIKIKHPSTWELKHRIVWESHFGEIPKGYNIQFKDGVRTNFNISNLYMISQSDQMKYENSLHTRYPKEIAITIQAIGALNRQINKL